MTIKDYIRRDLLNFKPYHAPLKPYDIKVDANENPFSHHPSVIEKTKIWLDNKDHLTRYPDTDSMELRTKLADFYQVSPQNIICGVGSDQLIEYVTKCFVEPGDNVLVPDPSFSMYGIANALNHGITINYELSDTFEYDENMIVRLCLEHNPKLLFICTPNNPTGSIISNEQVLSILKKVSCPVVLDEAYDEFVEESMVSYIKEYPNLLILRTFSKAFGCAGLRVGYGIGSEDMIEALNICKSPYNLPSISSAIAGFVLEEEDYYMANVSNMNINRELLYEELTQLEWLKAVYPSKANFILIKTSDEDTNQIASY
ncbi:MAG: histidinol-phosphate transaminase [Vallitaleaceae bacterium]|jgi:histidinol-phosphate aminotransferase|nr:histidinol-phosphate transaminase [Vallitaleaceae bacterium]